VAVGGEQVPVEVASMHLVAGRQKLDTVGASLPAEVGLSPNGQGGFQLDATLRVTLPDTIAPDAARALVEATYQVCPYSNANRGNIPVQLIIKK
jgi:osmotically inducible protein OsmC